MNRFVSAAFAAMMFFALGTCASAGLFGPGPGDFEKVYYQPKVLPTVDEAINTFTKLSKYYTAGYSHSRTIVDMQLGPTEMRYKHVRSWVESGYNWVPYSSGAFVGSHYVPIMGGSSQPWSEERYQESSDTIVFSTIGACTLEHTEGATDGTYPWRAVINAKDGEKYSNFWFGTNDPETAKRIVDAFYTLRAAAMPASNTLYPLLGVGTKSAEDAASILKRAKVPTGMEGIGAVVDAVAPGSPAALAGLMPGDVLYRMKTALSIRYDIWSYDDGTTNFQSLAAMLIGSAARAAVSMKAVRAGQVVEMSMTFANPSPGTKPKAGDLSKLGATFKPKADVATLLTQLVIPPDGPLLGVVIDKVENNSPAALGGVKPGDIVFSVARKDGTYFTVSQADNPWSRLEDVIESAADGEANPTLTLKIVRDGSRMELPVTIENPNAGLKVLRENMAKAAEAKKAAAAAAAAPKAVRLGVSGRDLSETEAKTAGVPGGVYVGGVDTGSPAELMGVRAGDYLLEINGATVTGVAAMRQALASGSVTRVKVWRAGKNLELRELEKM
jgi:S1-C subfamily serine protease